MARAKGIPNKRTNEFREILKSIKFDIPREAAKLYPTLAPLMKFKMLEFLSQYCYPKLFAKVIEDEELPQPMAQSTEELLALTGDIKSQAIEVIGRPISDDVDESRTNS